MILIYRSVGRKQPREEGRGGSPERRQLHRQVCGDFKILLCVENLKQLLEKIPSW